MAKHTSEAELRQLVAEGLTFGQIADRLGMSKSVIAVTCSCLAIRSQYIAPKRSDQPKGPRKNRPPVEAYLEDLKAGMSLGAIAKKYGRSGACVIHNALSKRGLPTTLRAIAA